MDSPLARIIKAHKELNLVLLGAYQHGMKYKLSVTPFTGNKNNERTVVGLEIFKVDNLYSDNGDC